MAEVANLREAAATIEELEADVRAANERRYAFRRMLAATDALLEPLETLNRDGVRLLPEGAVRAIRRRLRELPSSCLAALRDSDQVQEVLDGVFEVQDRLLRWRHPWLRDEEEAEPDPEPTPVSVDEQIVVAVRRAGADGISATALAQYVSSVERPITEVVDRLVTAGVLRCELRKEPSDPGPAARWYFAAGEGSGGE